ncbi:threonine/homoserine exporter RhtA [Pantoea agglomerans]|jgi:inner membrane transporter RhtA|uniref:threonine/homoserine exporter RhtA n=1 Tax=Enterobacter agglomerans TaxID=549 RepID=UPI00177BD0A8|nr:threonine/homoserine exporter RhtA [Pantoea agglomerans]MBD8157983.1 threonine/homoserine exporter RhtA [Pantoea agglomerans]MBD8233990.1 threonine/homoserine exporter RhtA [Pantoea agglomerans]MBD8249814.1 threonine/homoserine exporter RhtA [Pantoea agglomerans]MDK4217364.1 threonine/homoserine exporter RhtA [Pantoea agglomerans]WAB86696.1 threonine/homoserine exporter RhtA [Pantoea agglomerans]
MSASPSSKNLAPIVMPIAVLLIAMLSLQGGASLAKSLFPAVGATGITALRLGFGTLILCIIFKPWRLRFSREQRLPLLMYGLALGTMNFTFYLAIRTVPLGVAVGLEFTGPLALALFGSRRPLDFVWVLLAVIGLWFLLPFGTGMTAIDPLGAALAVSAGACWAIYILAGQRAGAEHGPATVAIGSLIASVIFVPLGLTFAESGIWTWAVMPIALLVALLSSAIPYSLEMIALTRLPARIFGTLMSLEPAMAAFSGMLFLGETLTGLQWLALLAIIIASAGSTLTMRPKKSQLNSVELSDDIQK